MVSKGRTPEAVGAQPCRHCGSPKHWDYDCKHAKKGGRRVRTNFADPTPDYVESQEAYDSLYYEDEDEDEKNEDKESGFQEPLNL